MLEAVDNIEDIKSDTEGMKLEIENLKKDLQETKESNTKLKGLMAEKEQAFDEQEHYSRINNGFLGLMTIKGLKPPRKRHHLYVPCFMKS